MQQTYETMPTLRTLDEIAALMERTAEGDELYVRQQRGPGVQPWILVGSLCGRGPDNEPLVRCRRPVAWISDEAQGSDEWGSLDRRSSA